MKQMTTKQFTNFVKSAYLPTTQDELNNISDIMGNISLEVIVGLLLNPETGEEMKNLVFAVWGDNRYYITTLLNVYNKTK